MKRLRVAALASMLLPGFVLAQEAQIETHSTRDLGLEVRAVELPAALDSPRTVAQLATLQTEAMACVDNEGGTWRLKLFVTPAGRIGRIEELEASRREPLGCLRRLINAMDLGERSEEIAFVVRIEQEPRMMLLGAIGRGGGGVGEGTIGLGNLGTIGHGSGGSSGASGYGRTRIRSGRATVRGSLSREVVRRVIRRHINEVRFCFEQGLARSPTLEGTVTTRFIISTTGSVQTAQVQASTLRDSRVEACIVRAVRRWRFPEPEGGGLVVVSYPFLLQTQGGSAGGMGQGMAAQGVGVATHAGQGASARQAPQRRVRGRLRFARPSVSAGLEREAVQRVVRRRGAAFRRCYERVLNRDPRVRGRVELRFEIGASGRVRSARVGDSSMRNAEVESCLISVVRRLRFPPPDGGEVVTVAYPLLFALTE